MTNINKSPAKAQKEILGRAMKALISQKINENVAFCELSL